MKVKKERNLLEMKSELDILNFVGHDYLLSASALQIDDNLFQSQFNILGKKKHDEIFGQKKIHYQVHYPFILSFSLFLFNLKTLKVVCI